RRRRRRSLRHEPKAAPTSRRVYPISLVWPLPFSFIRNSAYQRIAAAEGAQKRPLIEPDRDRCDLHAIVVQGTEPAVGGVQSSIPHEERALGRVRHAACSPVGLAS